MSTSDVLDLDPADLKELQSDKLSPKSETGFDERHWYVRPEWLSGATVNPLDAGRLVTLTSENAAD
jgi:hypothetical protein